MTKWWSFAGLAAGAAGMVLQIAAGSELYPTIPPGPIILLTAAGLVGWGPKRWAPAIATIASGFVIVGGIIASIVSGEFVEQLADVGQTGVFLGSLMQVAGLVIAFTAGVLLWRARADPGFRPGPPFDR